MTTPKALREMCESWLSPDGDRAIRLLRADGKEAHAQAFEEGQQMARALLDRLSGEAVTPDAIKNAREFLAEDEFPDEDGAMREQYIEAIRHLKAVVSLLPAGMDTGWLPIESAPKDGTYIVLKIENAGHPLVGHWFGGGSFKNGWWCAHTMPVHPSGWIPLPPT